MSDLDRTREQLVNDLMKAREQITLLQRQLLEYQQVDVAYPEMLLKAVPELILLFDRDGVIAEYKPAEEDPLRYGLPLESMVGQRYIDVFPPQFCQALSDALLMGRRASHLFSFNFEMDLLGVGPHQLQAWVKVFPGGSSACSIRAVSEQQVQPVETTGLVEKLPDAEKPEAMDKDAVRQAAILEHIRVRIKEASSVEEALQVAVRELGEALGSQRVTVQFEPNGLGERGGLDTVNRPADE